MSNTIELALTPRREKNISSQLLKPNALDFDVLNGIAEPALAEFVSTPPLTSGHPKQRIPIPRTPAIPPSR